MQITVRRVGAVTIVAMIFAACAGGLTPSVDLTTTDPAWQHWFRVEWTAEPGTSGHRRLTGYVQSDYGEDAYDLRLLAQALDDRGALVAQHLTWAMRVPALGRTFFDVGELPVAAHYRVTIWAFTVNQGAGWE
jgi:hypothetical protein